MKSGSCVGVVCLFFVFDRHLFGLMVGEQFKRLTDTTIRSVWRLFLASLIIPYVDGLSFVNPMPHSLCQALCLDQDPQSGELIDASSAIRGHDGALSRIRSHGSLGRLGLIDSWAVSFDTEIKVRR